MKLIITLKRQAFARAYVLSGNATQAAIEAGYSPKTAKQQGSRLLTRVDIKLALEAEQTMLRERFDLKAEDVLRGLRDIAEDKAAPHAARVSAWKALGNHLGLFQWNPVAEATTAFLQFLAGDTPTVEAKARHIELGGASSG